MAFLPLLVCCLWTALVSAQTPEYFTLDAGTKPSPTVPPTIPPNLTTACKTREADLVFLLDSSGSEGIANFKAQLKFISNIVKNFEVGPDAVQVSVATFATNVQNQFWLDEYQNKQDVIDAINNITFMSGNTATGLGLNFVLNETFTADHGARNNSNKILFVMTDGQSTNAKETLEAANNIHNTDIRVIAIGVGSSIDPNELSVIATDDKHVFTVANFSGLASIEKSVAYKTCKTEGLLCRAAPADILFLLDTSGSEGQTNFKKQLDFVKNFAKDFSIGPDAVQIAVATFATTTQSEFWFDEYRNQSALLDAIDNIQFRSGNTQTSLALKLGEGAFTDANGARNGSNHQIIVLTDGQSTNKAQTKQEANNIHNAGIEVIAIGIGNSIDQQEIKDIASGDGSQNAFSVANFDALHTIEKTIQQQTCKTETHCSTKPTDVVFLLDSSGSEGRTNFQKQLDFVNNFAKELPIGPNNVQVSVVTFSTNPQNQFWLNQYHDKAGVENAVAGVSYSGGNTGTDKALAFVRQNSFLPQNGGRPDADQVVIVLTDGHPNRRATAALEAQKLHQDSVKVISIGIGNNIDYSELTDIASQTDFAFHVANFDSLHKIESQVLTTTCSGVTSCKSEPSDIVFLLDSSGSEGSDNFKKQLTFVSNFVDGFDIGPNAVQFGLVTFSSSVQNRFWLNDFNNKAALKAAINRVPYSSGNTDTGGGLEFVRTKSLTDGNGARKNAHQVVIVMTDGHSQKAALTTQQAKMLHDAGAKVIAVGIGSGINAAELQNIATDPQHVFSVAGFNALHTIEKELQKTTCNQLGCATREADIMFVLDSSASESRANFKKQLDFAHNFIDKFEVSSSAAQFGVITFSTNVNPQFDLDKYSSKAPLLAAVDAIPYHSGGTATYKALNYVYNTSFTDAHGARPNATQIVIIMTDGASANLPQTHIEANRLHASGVEVLAIGIGRGINQNEVRALASDGKHVFSVDNFDALKTIQNELQNAACAVTPGFKVNATSTPLSGATCSQTTKADVMFLVDSSTQTGLTNFHQELNLMSSVVNHFEIGQNHMQFGAISYGSTAHLNFYLTTHRSKNTIIYAIAHIRFSGGASHPQSALSLAYRLGFSYQHGARIGVPRYAVFVVNGQPTSLTSTTLEANLLKSSGVKVIAVGVNNHVPVSELNNIATDSNHVLTAATFQDLKNLAPKIEALLC